MFRTSVVARVLVVTAALVTCGPALRQDRDDSTRLADRDLCPAERPCGPVDTAIRLAGDKLRALARPDGSFVYEYRVRDGHELAGYNIVRHAGAIYALAMFEHVAPDARTREVIARTTRYLLSAVRPLSSVDASAVFGMAAPGVVGDDAVLGASGLGVVALLAADALAPGSVPAPTLRALGRFLLLMQRDDGSFYSTWSPASGPSDAFDSLYYPGEAILALAELARWDHDGARWHDAAIRGMRFLASTRANASDVPSDNWALIATEELLARGGVDATDRELLIHHAAQIVAVNTAGQIADPKNALFGCYTDDGRTTPSSTHLEGLLAAAAVVPRETVAASIDAGIHFLLASQLPDGAIPADQRRKTVRIDYIQHALSAFIRYRAFAAAR